MKPTIKFAEILVTQVCNLVCKGCSTYSDLPSSGYKPWEQGKQELLPWLDKVNFTDIGFMGGEPLINPEILQWIVGVRSLMPETKIRFPTNATLLHKNWQVVKTLHTAGNSILKITVHAENDSVVEDAIQRVFDSYAWTPVTEYGIKRWRTTNDFVFQINRPKKFFKTFQNSYEDASPYNSNPINAFEVCHQKQCPLIHRGRIYKCSTSGLMDEVLKRFNYPNYNLWEPYLDNAKNGSIGLDSSLEELCAFADNIEQPHSVCQQCPTKDTIEIIDHLDNVIARSQNV